MFWSFGSGRTKTVDRIGPPCSFGAFAALRASLRASLRGQPCRLGTWSVSLQSVLGAFLCDRSTPGVVFAIQVLVWPKRLQTNPSPAQKASLRRSAKRP